VKTILIAGIVFCKEYGEKMKFQDIGVNYRYNLKIVGKVGFYSAIVLII